MSQVLEVAAEAHGAVLALSPLGRLDSNSSPQLEKRALAEVDAGRRRLVVDLSHADYISSAGLRTLLILAKRLKEPDARLVLCGMAPGVRQIFEIAGFLPIFTVEPSRESALARAAE